MNFLGAHAVPMEFEGRTDAYIDLVCEEMLPAIAKDALADSVDAFCETIAFDAGQVGRVFGKARELNLPVRLHADQLSDGGGAALAPGKRADFALLMSPRRLNSAMRLVPHHQSA